LIRSPAFKTIVLLSAVSCIFTISAAPQIHPGESMRGGFELAVTQEFDDEGRTLLVVNTTIPYRRLVFFRRENSYESRYRIYMELLDERNDPVRGDVWEESVVTGTYEETKAAASVSTTRKTFPIDSGEYTVNVTLEVIDTSLKLKKSKTVRIVGRGEGTLELAEPVFTVSKAGRTREKPPRGEILLSACEASDDRGISVIPGTSFAEFDGWLRVVYNLVAPSDTISDRQLVSMSVKDHRGTVLLYNRKRVGTGKAGLLTFCLEFNVDQFHIGEYILSMIVETIGADEQTSVDAHFTILLNRSVFADNFSEMLEILSIIAEEKELSDLREASEEERADAWLRFWKKRDPTPSTAGNEEMERFLGRVNYAVKNFSQFRPGWRTDRGRIYIKYGEPDKIINTDGKVLGSRIQYWIYYSQGLAYVFEDASGMGEYQLLTTQMI
jgi:GWxTD domain-containing protein